MYFLLTITFTAAVLTPQRTDHLSCVSPLKITVILSCSDLGDNHLQGEIPESIYWLQNLKNLDLTDNKLSGPLTSKVGHMTSITRLILSHNNFSGPIPVEIQNLTRLEYMVLNYNHFDGLFPIAVAPPQITVCLVQPNSFTACPSNGSVETSTTLAYQCNLDCRGTLHQNAELS